MAIAQPLPGMEGIDEPRDLAMPVAPPNRASSPARAFQPDQMPIQEALAKGNLPMFMTPTEIQQHLTLGDAQGVSNDYFNRPVDRSKETLSADDKRAEAQLIERKADEAAKSGKEGITLFDSRDQIDGPAEGPSLYDDIAAEGVQSPVNVGHQNMGQGPVVSLLDGHHRVASAAETRPNDLIQVQHKTQGYSDKPPVQTSI